MGCWTGSIIIGGPPSKRQGLHKIIDKSLGDAVSRLKQKGHDVEIVLNLASREQGKHGLSSDKALVVLEADSPGSTVPLREIRKDLELTIIIPVSLKGYKVERFVMGSAEHVTA